MQIKVAFLPVMLLMLTLFLVFSFSNTKIAYAHVTKMFGNIQVEVGWSNEPSLVGLLNNAIVQVNQTSGKNYSDACNQCLGQYEHSCGVTKPLDFSI